MVEVGKEPPRPYYVELEPDAKLAFKTWFNAHSEETESLDFPDYLGGTWSKMRGQVCGSRLIIDRLNWAYDPSEDGRAKDVSLFSLRAAIRLIDYFKAHARRAHALIRGCGGSDNEDARAILKWVYNTNRLTFSQKDVKNVLKTRFLDSENFDKAAEWLIARRCIRRLPAPARGAKGGRTPSPDSRLIQPCLRRHQRRSKKQPSRF